MKYLMVSMLLVVSVSVNAGTSERIGRMSSDINDFISVYLNKSNGDDTAFIMLADRYRIRKFGLGLSKENLDRFIKMLQKTHEKMK